jgi:hypothetical protein
MGVWYFLYVGGKGGRSLAEKEAEKNFLLQKIIYGNARLYKPH